MKRDRWEIFRRSAPDFLSVAPFWGVDRNSHDGDESETAMTEQQRNFELLQAAKGALLRLDDLRIHTEGLHRFISPDIDSSLRECASAAEYLRETIEAIEAK